MFFRHLHLNLGYHRSIEEKKSVVRYEDMPRSSVHMAAHQVLPIRRLAPGYLLKLAAFPDCTQTYHAQGRRGRKRVLFALFLLGSGFPLQHIAAAKADKANPNEGDRKNCHDRQPGIFG